MTLLRFWPPLPVIIRKPWRSNANNNRLRIVINTTLSEGQCFAGILAQERFEWGYKWRHLFTVDKVEMELLGHAIEAHVAATRYAMDLATYEWGEAEALLGYPQFAGWEVAKVLYCLQTRRAAASSWCAKHAAFIDWALRVEKEQ